MARVRRRRVDQRWRRSSAWLVIAAAIGLLLIGWCSAVCRAHDAATGERADRRAGRRLQGQARRARRHEGRRARAIPASPTTEGGDVATASIDAEARSPEAPVGTGGDQARRRQAPAAQADATRTAARGVPPAGAARPPRSPTAPAVRRRPRAAADRWSSSAHSRARARPTRRGRRCRSGSAISRRSANRSSSADVDGRARSIACASTPAAAGNAQVKRCAAKLKVRGRGVLTCPQLRAV